MASMTDRVQTGSMLFAVRVWPEETAAGLEYRGSAREVISGRAAASGAGRS
jgi:hypothetical protein